MSWVVLVCAVGGVSVHVSCMFVLEKGGWATFKMHVKQLVHP